MKPCNSCGETLTEERYRQVVMYGEPLCQDCIAQYPTTQDDNDSADYGNPFAREGDNQ